MPEITEGFPTLTESEADQAEKDVEKSLEEMEPSSKVDSDVEEVKEEELETV